MLVVVDAFTRFVWLFPSKCSTAQVTIQHLGQVFSIFGAPRVLVTDNAPAFLAREFKRFCFGSAIRHITTAPYHPQPSFAERVNRNLKSALIIFHSKNQVAWDQSIGWLTFAMNTAHHEAHRTTPASLMFAFPVNSPLSNLWAINDILPNDGNPATIRKNWLAAKNNILQAHKKEAARYNKGRRPIPLRVGCQVYLKNFGAQSKAVDKVTAKMLPRFVGPYEVIRVLTPVTFLIRQRPGGKSVRAHISQLKLVNEQGVGRPHVGRNTDLPGGVLP